MAAWPKLISAEMSTIVYDGGRSRKVKTLIIWPPTWPLIDPPNNISCNLATNSNIIYVIIF